MNQDIETIIETTEAKMSEIVVTLCKHEGNESLRFEFDEQLFVNLNSSDSQNELKAVFSKVLKELLEYNNIKLIFSKDIEYPSNLYFEVCQEYIRDLNSEINQSVQAIKEIVTGNNT